MAFKQMDIDLLDAAQKSHLLVNLDREIQGIAKSLSLLSSHNAPVPVAVTPPTAPPRPVNLQKMSGEEDEEEEEFAAKKAGGEEEEEVDFEALIGGMSEPPPQTNDEDEIDLT